MRSRINNGRFIQGRKESETIKSEANAMHYVYSVSFLVVVVVSFVEYS